jgi:predicted O-linked N-acetylglucosamine transferase (SPINDLY family)
MSACTSSSVKNNSIVTEDKSDSTVLVPNPESIEKKVKPVMSQKDQVLSEAVAISNDFYNNLMVQNYPAANKYLHPDALSVTSTSEWLEIYKKAQDKSGKMAYVNMVGHGAKCNIEGGNGVGDYAELIFDVQYKDANLREKLIYFRKDSTEKLKILGYEYDAILERVKLSDVLK